MDKLVKKLWRYVMHGQDISMEIRLFRLISLVVSLLCIFLILPVNMMQDLSPYVNIAIIIYGVATYAFYVCSCRGRHFIITLYLLTLLVLNALWFLNGGSVGSIGYYFVAAVLYPFIFFRGITRQAMFILLVFDNCSLLVVEYFNPQLVIPFNSESDRLIDQISGAAFSVITSALIFWVVVTSLERELEERKRAEQLVTDSENTLRTLMDFMPSGIWWFDENGKIEYLNRCFTELFGYALVEIPSLPEWFRLAYPDESYRVPYMVARNATIDEARRNGTAVPLREAKITCKDGTVRHTIINTQFVLGRTIEIFTDITEREQLHDQMLKMQKLESLGVLAGGIAHDFNNILTGIMGSLSFAHRFIDDTHKAYKPLETAERASARAAELAQQLLTFSKGGEPVKKVTSVLQLVEESLAIVLRGSNCISCIDIPGSLHAIEADEGQISQAFNNIVINAIQAMPDGGALTVTAKNELLSDFNSMMLPSGTYVKIVFIDQGCGISDADLKKIFDPYFTTKSSGNGLGLASVHSIIRRHGGHISVQSAAGKGATFSIYLPSTGMPYIAHQDDSAPPVSGTHAGGKILVMDDEEIIREMTSDMLEYLAYLPVTCESGAEAITLYKAAQESGTPFVAVIMDLTIPGGMGGKDAAKHILDLDPNACLIVSSGYSNDPVIANCKFHGFAGAVVKPYHINEFGSQISAALAGQQGD